VRLVVDEGVPVQVLEPLRRNKGHQFAHVTDLGWDGQKDQPLFAAAAQRGFDAIVALDVDQLFEPAEWRALRRSRLHHISLRQGRTVRGRTGVARVLASLIVAMPYVLADLATTDGQRIVEVALLAATARHELFDPRRERQRYPYWR
jgi:predicted nuclease of predicted toxin-antitoxin system